MEYQLLLIQSPIVLAQLRTKLFRFFRVHTLLIPMVVVCNVKVVRLTLHRMHNLLTQENILGKTTMMNHNITSLMPQVRWFQHMLPSRTILGKIGTMIEHTSLMELMAILLEKQSDGSLMGQTSLSFKI